MTGFVGFAARGPLDRPVRVTSFDEFEAVFGGEVELARYGRVGSDGEVRRDDSGEVLTAHLHGSVASFFEQGGRAAWVVRVAGGDAAATWIGLPGLAFLDGDRAVGAVLEAAWPGRWADRVRCQCQGEFTALATSSATVDVGGQLRIDPDAEDSIEGGATLLAEIEDADYLCILDADRTPAVTFGVRAPQSGEVLVVEVAGLGAGRHSLGTGILREAGTWELTLNSSLAVELSEDPARRIVPGDVLALTGPMGAALLFGVEGEPAIGADGRSVFRSATLLERRAALPSAGSLSRLHRLEVTVTVYDGERAAARIGAAALSPASRRYLGWRILEESSDFGSAAELDGGSAAEAWRSWVDPAAAPPPSEPLEPLGRRALSGRLAPLSTVASVEGAFPRRDAPLCVPVGVLGGVLRETRGPLRRAGRDGLDRYPSTSFFDSALEATASAALVESARAQRFVWGRRLLGMHSLITVDEVSLLALPDAVHPTWEDRAVAFEAEPVEEVARPVDPCPADFDDCTNDAQGVGESGLAAPPSEGTVSAVERLTGAVQLDVWTRIQAVASRLTEARADLVAILALPRWIDVNGARELRRALRRERGLTSPGPAGDSARQIADLGLVALVHPWVVLSGTRGRATRSVPPDGALCGVLARREASGGPWLSPGNQAVSGSLGLEPQFDVEGLGQLVDDQFLSLEQRAGTVQFVGGATQSDLARVTPIAVRRLIQFLHRECLRLGRRWVFETNGWELERDVRTTLLDLLEGVAERGGLASTVVGEGFELSVQGASDPDAVERGELVVVLRVAPAYPLEFIEIRLVRSGDESSWLVREA